MVIKPLKLTTIRKNVPEDIRYLITKQNALKFNINKSIDIFTKTKNLDAGLFVAKQKIASKSMLAELAKDKRPEILLAVAKNQNSPLRTLKNLVKCRLTGIRNAAKETLEHAN